MECSENKNERAKLFTKVLSAVGEFMKSNVKFKGKRFQNIYYKLLDVFL